MSRNGLFINGVFENVLQEILAVQSQLPEQIMFLQPYSGSRIVELAETPPSLNDPVPLFVSPSHDLSNIHFAGEIVGWDDKRSLNEAKKRVLNRLIFTLQPGEDGLYLQAQGIECVNLLHVRRLKRLAKPFSVGGLTNARDGTQLSPNRSRSGGWVYVVPPALVD